MNNFFKTFLFIPLLLIVGLIFFFNTSVSAQQGCAEITSITSNINLANPQSTFYCRVTVSTPFAGSRYIACGLSLNGGWPTNYCPSDLSFGGWQGNEATFNCEITAGEDIPANVTKVELVAFDFRSHCGPQTGKNLLIRDTAHVEPTTSNQNPPNLTPPIQDPSPTQQTNIVAQILQLIFGSAPLQDIDPLIPPSTDNTPPPTNNTIVSIADLLNPQGANYSANLISTINPCFSNSSIYKTAETYTGVSWQVLGAIHFKEGSCRSDKSLVSGRTIGANEPDIHGNCSSQNTGLGLPIPLPGGGCGFDSLLSSAIYAGNHLKGKIGKTPETFEELTKALSRYNGGGNSNCGKTPYANCPKKFYGEDDTYVMNLFDELHEPMYIVYCADYTLCSPPKIDQRIGTATAARILSIPNP